MRRERAAGRVPVVAGAARRSRTRARIIDAARAAFLEQGLATSVDAVAAAAGVARATVFNQFGSKEHLFEVVVEETLRALLTGMTDVPEDLPLRETLLRYARNYVAMALHPDSVGLSRIAMSAAEPAAAIGHIAYRTGYSGTVPVLAAYLRKQMALGQLVAADPTRAAERFFAAAIGHSRHRILLRMPRDSARRIDAFLVETVELFLRAMRPR